MNRLNATRSVLPFCLVMSLAPGVHAQSDDKRVNFDGYKITATQEQLQKLQNAEDGYDRNQRQLISSQRKLETSLDLLKTKYQAYRDKLLTMEQKQEVAQQDRQSTRAIVSKHKQFFERFAAFAQRMAEAEEVVIYEALPRAEEKELAAIKQKSETIQIEGYDFYKRPIVVSPTQLEEMRRLLTNYAAFTLTPEGGKFCGGFHPDICWQYRAGQTACRMHVCLGCMEILDVNGDQRASFDFDLDTCKQFIRIVDAVCVHHVFQHPLKDSVIGESDRPAPQANPK